MTARPQPPVTHGTVWAFPPPPPRPVSESDPSGTAGWWHAPALARIEQQYALTDAPTVLLGWPPDTGDLEPHTSTVLLSASPRARLEGCSPSPRPDGRRGAGLVVLAASAAQLASSTGGLSSNDREHPIRRAARLLGGSGFLAVLTVPGERGGELDDPSGALVRRAQDVGLAYFQHIVIVTVPLSAAGFLLGAPVQGSHGSRTHIQVHRDLLVFQRRDHHPARHEAWQHRREDTR